MTIMRLCYVSLRATPFEALQEINKTQASQQKTETNPQEILRKNKVLPPVENNQNNLAEKIEQHEMDEDSLKITNFEIQMKKFTELVNIIENESEMQLAFNLRNSFKLHALHEINIEKKVGEIELESTNKK